MASAVPTHAHGNHTFDTRRHAACGVGPVNEYPDILGRVRTRSDRVGIDIDIDIDIDMDPGGAKVLDCGLLFTSTMYVVLLPIPIPSICITYAGRAEFES